MTPLFLAATGAGVVAAAGNAAANGPDYVGIAAVIAACASAFGTIVAGIITILRFLKKDDAMTPEDVAEAVREALRREETS